MPHTVDRRCHLPRSVRVQFLEPVAKGAVVKLVVILEDFDHQSIVTYIILIKGSWACPAQEDWATKTLTELYWSRPNSRCPTRPACASAEPDIPVPHQPL